MRQFGIGALAALIGLTAVVATVAFLVVKAVVVFIVSILQSDRVRGLLAARGPAGEAAR